MIEQQPDISQIAGLLGDRARARMMTALMGGKSLTATELALEADITPQTASSHLARLLDNKLVVVQKQGRHKYFQLAGYQVAELLETLLNLSAGTDYSTVQTGPMDPALRQARICYDHLAGELGVQLLDALRGNQLLEEQHQTLVLTSAGETLFQQAGADIGQLSTKRRPLCKHCLDWSERRHHLAGTLGHWVLQDVFQQGWAQQDMDSRVIRFTPRGLNAFRKRYGIDQVTAT